MSNYAPTQVLRRLRGSAYWRDVAWLASGTAAAQLVNLGTMPLFSRLFTPSEFAVQNLVVQIATFFGVLATVRYEYLVKLPPRDVDAWRLVSLVVMLGIGAIVVVTPPAWFFRNALARLAGDPQLAPWLVVVPVTAVATSVSIALQGFAQRQQQYGHSASAEILGRLAYAGTTLSGFWILPGAGGLVFAGLGGALGKSAWLLRVSKRRFQEAPASYRRLALAHGRMGGSLVLSHVLMAASTIIPLTFVAHAYGPSTLGQYAMANSVVSLPSALVGNAIGDVFYQRAAKRWAEGKGFGDIWRSTASKLLAIGLPMYAIAGFAMPWAFPLIFGHQWVEAGQFGAILCVVGFFSFATSPMGWANVVVNVDWYGPVWMGMRAGSAAVAVLLAMRYHWSVRNFVIATVVQSGTMYGIDYWAKWRFANRIPDAVALDERGVT